MNLVSFSISRVLNREKLCRRVLSTVPSSSSSPSSSGIHAAASSSIVYTPPVGPIQNAYDIGKLLTASGLTTIQVDALMRTIEFLRSEGKGEHSGYVTKLHHKADLSELDLKGLKRVSDLKHELAAQHHIDYRELRNEQTKFEALTTNDVNGMKTDITLMEVRRNSTRELQEKNVEAQLEHLQSDLSQLENRVMRFSVGMLGTTCLVGLGIAKLVL